MTNPFNPRRLLTVDRQSPPRPADTAPHDPHDPHTPPPAAEEPATRRKKSPWKRGAALLGGIGSFYMLSVVGHALVVGLLVAVPLKLSSATRAKHRPRPLNTEIKPPGDSSTFEFGGASIKEPTQQILDAAVATRTGTKPASTSAEEHPQDETPILPVPPQVAVDPATDAADNEAARVALGAALQWLARHQEQDGRWSLVGFESHCRGGRCGGAGAIRADAAATGLALTAFLNAADVPAIASDAYRDVVQRGTRWLLEHQRADGDLSADGEQRMYSHAAAGMALCRHYALTRDERVGYAAQLAVRFTEAAQNPTTGSWHYDAKARQGNTSSVAWQLMLFRSAESSGLKVDPQSWSRAQVWLKSVSQGKSGGLFSYEPGRIVTPAMTCVGLLGLQHRGASLNDPAIAEGLYLLRAHPPDKAFSRDVFYWYLGSPVVRNMGEVDWKPWFYRLRRDLIDAQATFGCAAGSWYLGPTAPESWSVRGGRLLSTSLAAQLLASGLSPKASPGPAFPAPIAAAVREGMTNPRR